MSLRKEKLGNRDKTEERQYEEIQAKQEKSMSVLPVTARMSKQRQGLNLYGCFIQTASDLRRLQFMYPKDHFISPLKPTFFIRRRKG